MNWFDYGRVAPKTGGRTVTKLASEEISKLDPYKFMATIGKRVIHPGGRASSEALLDRAAITADSCVLDVGCGVATTAVEIARRFGAQVTAGSLGITLGHGMSRFDTHPGHPNAPAPRKRPLHNMCPSICARDSHAIFALGGAGGVRIPSAVYEVIYHLTAGAMPLREAVDAPRFHTTGTPNTMLDKDFPRDAEDYLREAGFQMRRGEPARVSAVSFEPSTGACRAAMR